MLFLQLMVFKKFHWILWFFDVSICIFIDLFQAIQCVLCSIFMFSALEFFLESKCLNYQLRIWFKWALDSLPPFINISAFALDKNSHGSRNFLSCKWKSCASFVDLPFGQNDLSFFLNFLTCKLNYLIAYLNIILPFSFPWKFLFVLILIIYSFLSFYAYFILNELRT